LLPVVIQRPLIDIVSLSPWVWSAQNISLHDTMTRNMILPILVADGCRRHLSTDDIEMLSIGTPDYWALSSGSHPLLCVTPGAAILHANPPLFCWWHLAVAFLDSRRKTLGAHGRGDKREDMSPFEIPTLKIFLSKQYRICDIQSNVQRVFLVSGDFVCLQTPYGAPMLRTEPRLLSPFETNSWLRPWKTLCCDVTRLWGRSSLCDYCCRL